VRSAPVRRRHRARVARGHPGLPDRIRRGPGRRPGLARAAIRAGSHAIALGDRRVRRACRGGVLRRQDPGRGFGLGPSAHAAARAGRRVPRRGQPVARWRTRRRRAGRGRGRCTDQPHAQVRHARTGEPVTGTGQQLDRLDHRGRRRTGRPRAGVLASMARARPGGRAERRTRGGRMVDLAPARAPHGAHERGL
ncbi:MAG: FIG034602: Probable transmembrane protein, partial [uncultured Lysobacter sp.]